MVEATLGLLIAVVLIALIFDFVNGFNDSANAIATCVSTRALSIPAAIVMSASLNFLGAVVSTKVAATIGQGIVHANEVTQLVILSGLGGAVVWSTITWYFGLPSSSTHALVGGLIGASLAHVGPASLEWVGIKKILCSLITSPLVGLLLGFWMMVIILWIVRNLPPEKLNKSFRKLQIVAAAFVAFSHGTADAQKSMGIITMALLNYGAITTFSVPIVVIIACALMISVGTAIGGWRIVKTIGRDFVKLEPVHGFCVQTATAGVILTASAYGLPTSTTHVITSSIFGVGLSKGLSAVNWKVAKNIATAWILTIPGAGAIGFFLYAVVNEVCTKLLVQ